MQRNKMILSLGVVVALVGGAAAATQLQQCDGAMCTLEARPSVVVKITDESGNAMPATSVWYEFIEEDADTQLRTSKRAECVDAECTEWIASREQPGIYAIHADVCGQMFHERGLHVGMTEDDCHVDTKEIVFAAKPCDEVSPTAGVQTDPGTQCTLELRPSVIVDVVAGEDGHPMPAESVWFAMKHNTEDADLAASPLPREDIKVEGGDGKLDKYMATCTNEDCTQWSAGLDQPGHYWLWARTCGSVIEYEVDVKMQEDGCHVQTQQITMTADNTKCLSAG